MVKTQLMVSLSQTCHYVIPMDLWNVNGIQMLLRKKTSLIKGSGRVIFVQDSTAGCNTVLLNSRGFQKRFDLFTLFIYSFIFNPQMHKHKTRTLETHAQSTLIHASFTHGHRSDLTTKHVR